VEYVKDETGTYIIRLEKDEKVFATLEKIAVKENWTSGYLTGIGALKNSEIGSYNLETKVYKRQLFPEIVELISMNGNMCFNNGKPFFHIHTVLGDHDFKCFGGHLFEAEVGITVEIIFRPLNLKIHRIPHADVGLSLLNLNCPI